MNSRNNLQAKVRSILELANHPSTPHAEAENALAHAFRLMQKYGLDESDVSGSAISAGEIVSKTFTITGPYRVRRGTLLWTMSKTLSCHAYRDMMQHDSGKVTIVAFGTSNDLLSLGLLFQAAEMLAIRLLPAGDRRFRTSWWHGYCDGIARKLESEHRKIVKETPGAGLVLVERAERARRTMTDTAPHLRTNTSRYSNDRQAYGAGQNAGTQFTAGRNAVGSNQRAIGSG
jgi:hypothetical protein